MTAVRADSANLADLDALYRAVGERGRGLDVVVANSGSGSFASLGEITEEQFGTNVLHATRVSPAFSVHSATKAAVRNFARSWPFDLKGTGTRVNVLSPGPTLTPGEGQEALVDGLVAEVPLGRMGDPAEIAAAALFLASAEAGFVNGVEVFVDGGQAQI
ncbi:MAG TPA: SDR family oxidoreductase [Amycolatopsis sp.]|uniref:SDR family oxidoreductase n=1 Tax=Amycolatopsis sp. TaxID=37632 RepID=UPI002F3F9E6D